MDAIDGDDLNLVADTRYAINLFEALVPLRIPWYGLATTLLGDDDSLLRLVARSGCRGLLMGLESLSPASLRAARKGFNDPSAYAALVEELLNPRPAHEVGLAESVVSHLHVRPVDTHPEPGPQRLQQGLLGGEMLGGEVGLPAARRVGLELVIAQDALGKAAAVTLDSGLDA